MSSPIEPKPGCRFAPRCVHAKEICSREEPPTVEVSPGHMVAYHLAGQLS
ncbi:oligopeptide/dipeptide ABC transporter ATP-binding protein [Intestinimonas sp. MSJ-38]